MLKKLKLVGSGGDTIVEVMVVLAVLGLAIGIAYATANGSLAATSGAQENSQATEVLQSQIEALRYMSDNPDPSNNIFQPGPYCITSPVGDFVVNVWPGATTPDPACIETSAQQYTTSITYASGSNTFTLVTKWPDIHGQGTDSVTLVYRLYQ